MDLATIASVIPEPTLRAYAAAIVGGRGQRNPQMSRYASFGLAPGEPALVVAENTSSDQALLIEVETIPSSATSIRFSENPMVSTSDPPSTQAGPGFPPPQFILLPGDALYAQWTAGAPATLVVGQEYY